MGLILSGVQPTGNLHLGNYLGAIKNWVKLQDEHKCLFMLADLHAITVHQEPKELQENILKVAALYLACGIDPKKSVIFNQSRVAAHAELAWILGCNTPIGWLNRMTQFKDKIKTSLDRKLEDMYNHPTSVKAREQQELKQNNPLLEKAVLGLYAYPVLMAADILIYNTTHVPVGEDQKQHLELARDIGAAFNRNYGTEFFTIPEPMILPAGARVMSLRDGTKKMSKSDESDYSRINLTDSAEDIRKKLQKAKSDAIEGITYDYDRRPEVANLLGIYGALYGEKSETAAKKFASYNFSKFKTEIADAIIAKLEPITSEYNRLMNDRIMLMKVLDEGAAKANTAARANLAKVKEIVGLI